MALFGTAAFDMVTRLDWVLIAVMSLSLVVGAWRGLVYEVLSVLAWAVSFYTAQWFAPDVAAWLPMPSWSAPVQYAAAFVLVFVLSLFACSFVAFVVKKLVEAIGLRPIDRVLGALFGAARGVILLLAATVVIQMTSLRASDWWTQSQGASALTTTLAGIKPLLPEKFAAYLD